MSLTIQPKLAWHRKDVEQRLGFRGQPFTRVNGWLSGLVAIALTILSYSIMFYFGSNGLSDMFLQRGVTPYFILLLTYWAIVILTIKFLKLSLQKKALTTETVPQNGHFVLTVHSVDQVLNSLYAVADDPKKFMLFNRILIAISNLRNLGRVTDVGEILRSRAEHDESVVETSYSTVRHMVWAIPILGFIGTVEGLSTAIGGFGKVLSETTEPTALIESLKGVTGGLATAFETTFLALVAALIVQSIMSFLKKREEEFLDDCEEYCHQNLVNRLRLSPIEEE